MRAREAEPADYTALLVVPGVGAPRACGRWPGGRARVRGAQPSIRDPVSYAFARGGKDGTPFSGRPRHLRRDHRIAAPGPGRARGKVQALKGLAVFSPAR